MPRCWLWYHSIDNSVLVLKNNVICSQSEYHFISPRGLHQVNMFKAVSKGQIIPLTHCTELGREQESCWYAIWINKYLIGVSFYWLHWSLEQWTHNSNGVGTVWQKYTLSDHSILNKVCSFLNIAETGLCKIAEMRNWLPFKELEFELNLPHPTGSRNEEEFQCRSCILRSPEGDMVTEKILERRKKWSKKMLSCPETLCFLF